MQRFTFLHKAALIRAAQESAKERRRIMREHDISEEEFAEWEKLYEAYGAAGLRVTRLKSYRKPVTRAAPGPMGGLEAAVDNSASVDKPKQPREPAETSLLTPRGGHRSIEKK